ncbi:hypothetical protein [Roseococcus sp. YIM B11640]|uniref:hypothetical protein n=1 Tax=Roseococcus sp. YIM B11640 TaxID=3133973 RepID=UPI003C7B801D
MLDSLEPAGLVPAMSPAEQSLLREAARGAASAVEFGTGGSTRLLLEVVAGQLVSTESDPAWLERVRADPACAAAEASGRWRGLHADLGPVGRWGWPADAARHGDGAIYAEAPWKDAPTPGFVLVDGRFRVACALSALARLAPGGLVAIHDFWPREYYRPVLEWADLVGTSVSLVLLRPKPGATIPAPGAFHRDPR